MEIQSNPKQLSNYSRVLRYIFRKQPVSRSEIASELNLPRSLITAITGTLLSRNIIKELGKAEITNDKLLGRRKLLIGICAQARFCIGVEISVHHFHFCITDLSGQVYEEIHYLPTREQIKNVNQSIITGVRQLLATCSVDHNLILGVGIAIPGHVNLVTGGVVSHSSLWENFCLSTLIQALNLEITVENNVRAMAYEKFLFDIQNCPEDFALLHVSSGIVCAHFLGGILTEGGYISGEIGHTISNPQGHRCECGKIGCLQTYASETWIIKKAQNIWQYSSETLLRHLVDSYEHITIETVLQAYKLGDPLVMKEIREALLYLGIAIANIMIILGAKKLFLHSQIFQSEPLYQELKQIVEEQLAFIGLQDFENVTILDFAPSRAAIGAAALAIDRLFIQNNNL